MVSEVGSDGTTQAEVAAEDKVEKDDKVVHLVVGEGGSIGSG